MQNKLKFFLWLPWHWPGLLLLVIRFVWVLILFLTWSFCTNIIKRSCLCDFWKETCMIILYHKICTSLNFKFSFPLYTSKHIKIHSLGYSLLFFFHVENTATLSWNRSQYPSRFHCISIPQVSYISIEAVQYKGRGKEMEEQHYVSLLCFIQRPNLHILILVL